VAVEVQLYVDIMAKDFVVWVKPVFLHIPPNLKHQRMEFLNHGVVIGHEDIAIYKLNVVSHMMANQAKEQLTELLLRRPLLPHPILMQKAQVEGSDIGLESCVVV